MFVFPTIRHRKNKGVMAEFHVAASVSGLLVWFMLAHCHTVLVNPEWNGASLMLMETPVKMSAVKRFRLPRGGVSFVQPSALQVFKQTVSHISLLGFEPLSVSRLQPVISSHTELV